MPPAKAPAVSQEQFSKLEALVTAMAEKVLAPTPVTAQEVSVAKEAVEVKEAGPEENPLNPHWRRAIDEILGKDFDAYAKYPLSGGCVFTVIVPREKSNAPQLYFEMHKQDRRSREIAGTGLEGVKKWCDLIKKNLARSKSTNTI